MTEILEEKIKEILNDEIFKEIPQFPNKEIVKKIKGNCSNKLI